MVEWDFNTTFVPRMTDPRDLTTEEICGMMSWLSKTPSGIDGMLNARLALQQMKLLAETRRAIEKFDDSSAKLTTRIYWLTWVLVFLAAATVIAPFLMRH